MQSLKLLKGYACNLLTLPKIEFIILGRDPSKDDIFNLTSEQIKKSTTWSTLDKKVSLFSRFSSGEKFFSRHLTSRWLASKK